MKRPFEAWIASEGSLAGTQGFLLQKVATGRSQVISMSLMLLCSTGEFSREQAASHLNLEKTLKKLFQLKTLKGNSP